MSNDNTTEAAAAPAQDAQRATTLPELYKKCMDFASRYAPGDGDAEGSPFFEAAHYLRISVARQIDAARAAAANFGAIFKRLLALEADVKALKEIVMPQSAPPPGPTPPPDVAPAAVAVPAPVQLTVVPSDPPASA
jgi:hypothetical protein